MKEEVEMGMKEAERFSVMQQVDKKILTITEAGKELGLSLRQVKRVRKRYLSQGAQGLISLKKGKVSNRRICQGSRIHIMQLVETQYADFGPTLARKKLERAEEMNRRFGKEAALPEDAHRPLRKQDDLKRIFARKDQRKLSKNLTFQHQGILYLVETKHPNRMRNTHVEVLWNTGEPIEVWHQGIQIAYKKWSETAYEQPKIMNCKEIAMHSAATTRAKPARNHPWR